MCQRNVSSIYKKDQAMILVTKLNVKTNISVNRKYILN